ncbi:MAG: hypothetical protein ACT6QU_14670 [Aliihoeflea sp.]|uniref:hypothetical protein n=1 Tax=Aliihoeflea sp. TaxID=2608088 RepID=UPI00403457EC
MPREISGTAEAQRQRMIRYRKRLRERQCPETDAVDGAVSDAVAVLVRLSSNADKLSGYIARAAVNLLVSRGYDRKEAIDRVRRRMGRLEARDLIPIAAGRQG